MHYTFHSRSYKDREAATTVFYRINAQMEEVIPNAFLTVAECSTGDWALLLGCHDDDASFVTDIESIWSDGEPIDIDIEVWMALEAKHARCIAEHVVEGSGEDLVTLGENVHLRRDGTTAHSEEDKED